jgi:hypothetical protein
LPQVHKKRRVHQYLTCHWLTRKGRGVVSDLLTGLSRESLPSCFKEVLIPRWVTIRSQAPPQVSVRDSKRRPGASHRSERKGLDCSSSNRRTLWPPVLVLNPTRAFSLQIKAPAANSPTSNEKAHRQMSYDHGHSLTVRYAAVQDSYEKTARVSAGLAQLLLACKTIQYAKGHHTATGNPGGRLSGETLMIHGSHTAFRLAAVYHHSEGETYGTAVVLSLDMRHAGCLQVQGAAEPVSGAQYAVRTC